MLFVGDDWAEDHHDVEIVDEVGRVLARRRLPEGVGGIAALHELIGRHSGPVDEPPSVAVGIETDRGRWVQALIAAGYEVFAINPMSVARYRERHVTSGTKSDPGTPTCWPSWSASTGPITARSPATPSWPRR